MSQVTDFQGVTIEEALEPVKAQFIQAHKEDTIREIARRRQVVRDARQNEKEFAFAIWEKFQDRNLTDRHATAPYETTEWKVGDVYLKAWGSTYRNLMKDLRQSENEEDVLLVRRFFAMQEDGQKAKNYLGRVGADYGDPSDERLEKMALRAWIGRLATLEKAVVRKGLDTDSARVLFFETDGADYILAIQDKDGKELNARTILAGGPQVRLHLRFICT
jgi:hypothetical protein